VRGAAFIPPSMDGFTYSVGCEKGVYPPRQLYILYKIPEVPVKYVCHYEG